MNKVELKGIPVVSGGEFDRGSAEDTMHKGMKPFLGNKNIIEYENRPFHTTEEMIWIIQKFGGYVPSDGEC